MEQYLTIPRTETVKYNVIFETFGRIASVLSYVTSTCSARILLCVRISYSFDITWKIFLKPLQIKHK